MHDWQRQFIDFLVESGAFRLGTFTLKSGRTSPTFVNTGLIDDGYGLLRQVRRVWDADVPSRTLAGRAAGTVPPLEDPPAYLLPDPDER